MVTTLNLNMEESELDTDRLGEGCEPPSTQSQSLELDPEKTQLSPPFSMWVAFYIYITQRDILDFFPQKRKPDPFLS